MEIYIKDLPKISLNAWYAGSHWSKRTRIKNNYKILVRQATKLKFKNPCNCEYHFTFKSNPLDASNTVAMVKMIEDCLFENDGYKIVKSIKLTSCKGNDNSVKIIINEIKSEK